MMRFKKNYLLITSTVVASAATVCFNTSFSTHAQTPLQFVMPVPNIDSVRNEQKDSVRNDFKVGQGNFTLNGKPFVIKAAELHYPRIPKEYWDQRIKLSKALGMNTICLYTFWNAHEPREGQFDFTGQNDIREFIRLCEENGMLVILRPGPYVCAEWEMGGLPWWLLKKKDIRLRENDPYFLERVDAFQKALAAEIGDLTADKGGPIIMVQVENEYGSYGEDKEYIANIRDMLKKNFGEDVVMFQCDWSSNFTLNGLDDLVWTMNFGTGADIDAQFAELKRLRPDSPLMCSEFWSGWFDKWGANHETRSADDMIAGIDEMLGKDISFSLYMTHGGTNWGHWAGANSPGYAPDVTSYDYDAPISESGQPTPKFWLLRETLEKYNDGKPMPELPELIEPVSIEKFSLDSVAPLFSNLPEEAYRGELKTFEEMDMGFGSMLYTTELPAMPEGGVLTVTEPHDYAQIFVDGTFIGSLDRRKGETELKLPAFTTPSKLDILIEGMGRINFGRAIKDFKGITDNVTVSGNIDGQETSFELTDWTIKALPDELGFYEAMEFVPVSDFANEGRLPRGVYKGTFYVEKPSDTFLNFETWGKGLVYVNGHPLGRIWEIGPQQTLYTPGPWLREGENEILIFDIMGPTEAISEGLEAPIIDKLGGSELIEDKNGLSPLDFEDSETVYSGTFNAGNGWQEKNFGKLAEGRYVMLTALNANDGGNASAVSEIYLLDENGERLPRENWKPAGADSEDLSGNHTVDKAFDLQESTYWQSESGDFPHYIIIDLGEPRKISGIQYLPRMESGAPGSIRNFEIKIR